MYCTPYGDYGGMVIDVSGTGPATGGVRGIESSPTPLIDMPVP